MSLLVTGSIGIDTVSSPHGSVENVLGGSAVYFSFAASFYTPVRLVAVVGEDFPNDFHQTLKTRNIDLQGLEFRKGSQTFRWSGRYQGDMNEAETVGVTLNVLGEHGPKVPPGFADSKTVFLANTHPALQREFLTQLHGPRLVVCDTMNHWIVSQRDALLATFLQVTGVILNDQEARLLSGKINLIEAGEWLLERGPKFVIIKKGEHGAILVTPEGTTTIPAFPTKDVRDPTGAGDSFAGGTVGFLAAEGKHDVPTLRRAMIRGTVAASFAIEDFSLSRVLRLTDGEVRRRVDEYTRMLRIE